MNRTAIVLVAGLAAACGNSSIAEGRGHGMPSWGTKINVDDVWKLVRRGQAS